MFEKYIGISYCGLFINLTVTSMDYLFYFSEWRATVLLIFVPIYRREGARWGCGA